MDDRDSNDFIRVYAVSFDTGRVRTFKCVTREWQIFYQPCSEIEDVTRGLLVSDSEQP